MTDGSPAPGGPPPHFLVIVPGYMGSKLRDKTSGRMVWVDIPALWKDPFDLVENINSMLDSLAYPNPNIEPVGIMDQVIFVPPWSKQEHYGRLTDAIRKMGYMVDPQEPNPKRPTAYTFAYDWRQDNRLSARQLGEAVQRWKARHPGHEAWLIGHSNGGIVARWYIEKEGGKEHVGRLFLMGSPWDGAPKALNVMLNGLDVFLLKKLDKFGVRQRMNQITRSFPSFYQIIPYSNPFLRDENNQDIDLFADPSWLESEADQQRLLDGRKFNEELGTGLSVDTVCFVGRMKPTLTSAIVHKLAGKGWGEVVWQRNEAGDGTVPERSAVNQNARAVYTFAVDHGGIYADPQVMVQLEWELVGKYNLASRAALLTDDMTILFEPEKEVYAPGEKIQVWAEIRENDPKQTPVSGASVRVLALWSQELPGQEGKPPAETLRGAVLEEDQSIRGRYVGNLEAPQAEGYYRLNATVRLSGKPNLVLEELISVEEPVA